MASLGKRMQTLRKRQDFSQSQLGRRSGIKREYISRLEQGKLKNPTLNTLKKIAHGLGVSLENLLFSDPSSHSFQDLLRQSKRIEQKIDFLRSDVHELGQKLERIK